MSGHGVDTELMDVMIKAAEFHGHLGPFLTIGVRMGLLGKRTLKSDGFRGLHVIVNTGNNPPLSCVVDGVQVATGCTLGKGNIAVRNLSEISAVFHARSRIIRVKLKIDVLRGLEVENLRRDPARMEETAKEVNSMSDAKLFSIEEVRKKTS